MYLATTRLRDFWPDYKPIVMLGEWCIPEGELFTFKPDGDYSILPYPWDDRERFGNAAEYVQNVYERLLVQFAEALNDIHGLDKSVTYWRIIIGPWLSWYLEAFYDRYVCLLGALQEDSEIITIGLNPESYATPDDCSHFVNLYIDDEYNLMLYTQILEALGVEMVRKKLPPDWQYQTGWIASGQSFINIVKPFILEISDRIRENIVRKSKIALVSSGIPFVAGLKLWILSGFKITSCPRFKQLDLKSYNNNNDARDQLKGAIKPCDDFESIIKSTISQNVPKAYIENFGKIRQYSLRGFENVPEVILSANGWYSDEVFKFFAAEAHDAGSKLVSMQHGGYYGMLKYISPEIHEQKVGEYFYSWGWTNGIYADSNVKIMPSIKLSSLSRIPYITNKRKKEQIILVTTEHPRYLYRFQSHPVGPQWAKYFEDEIHFYQSLKDIVKKQLKVRLYLSNYKHGFKKRWLEKFPDIQFDNASRMQDNLISSSILIIDHPSTIFLEALVADVPTVLFWNPSQFILRENIQADFDELRRVGILHDDPEFAATKVNEIYENPELWWHQPEIQNIKNKFCRKFAYTSKIYLHEWKIQLLNNHND